MRYDISIESLHLNDEGGNNKTNYNHLFNNYLCTQTWFMGRCRCRCIWVGAIAMYFSLIYGIIFLLFSRFVTFYHYELRVVSKTPGPKV